MRRWYGVAVGGLAWSPKDFWRSTIAEFFMAIEGHNAIEMQKSGQAAPLSRAEFEALEAEYLHRG